jgi:hypothetical protein
MKVEDEKLTHYRQTGDKMKETIQKYSSDIGDLKELDLDKYYDFVRKIPYTYDQAKWDLHGEDVELLVRPKIILENFKNIGIDCKKKAILIGSWFKENHLINRLVCVSEMPNKNPHHVFNQLLLNGDWLNVDATYPEYELFEIKHNITYLEEL